MANQNAQINENEDLEITTLEELESKLELELDGNYSDLENLKNEFDEIGNTDNLATITANAVLDQVNIQIASILGEEFIIENNGLTLDLSNDAHIQTAVNLKEGKLATHNTKIDYEERYDNYQEGYTKDVRRDFDAGREYGTEDVHMDHTISVFEMVNDPEINTYIPREEQIEVANSDVNLNEMDASANMSKGNKQMEPWLDSEKNGKAPEERFDIDADELREQDKIAREEYAKLIEKGKKEAYETGRESQREEAYRMADHVGKAIIATLLIELLREIFKQVALWFKSEQKNINSLINHVKKAIHSFFANLKRKLLRAADTAITSIASMIYGPIVRTLKRVWILLVQGFKSIKEAIDYIRNPENKDKSHSIMVLEVGKIVIAGLTVGGAIVLSDIVEKSLLSIMPFLGGLAMWIGIFLGGIISGIVGAIVVNIINRNIEKQKKSENISKQIDTFNEALANQNTLISVKTEKIRHTEKVVLSSIADIHSDGWKQAKNMIEDMESLESEGETESNNSIELNEMRGDLLSLKNNKGKK